MPGAALRTDGAGADWTGCGVVGCGVGVPIGTFEVRASTSTRSLPLCSSWWSQPSSLSEPSTRGLVVRPSTSTKRLPAIAKTRRPSVLTVSGSSTPASCTFVVEKSGSSPPSPLPPAALSGMAGAAIGGIGDDGS